MKKKQPPVQRTIRFAQDELKFLTEQAARRGVSVHDYVRRSALDQSPAPLDAAIAGALASIDERVADATRQINSRHDQTLGELKQIVGTAVENLRTASSHSVSQAIAVSNESRDLIAALVKAIVISKPNSAKPDTAPKDTTAMPHKHPQFNRT